MKRHAWVIRLRQEKVDEYRRLHQAVWPQVLATISACHIRNYSIFLRTLDDGQAYLFACFEHAGGDLRADLARMAADPATQAWWKLTDPCQEPLRTRADGEEKWAAMEEVFHTP